MKKTEIQVVIPTMFTMFSFLGTWLLALHLKETAITTSDIMNGLMAGVSYIVYVWLSLLKSEKIKHWLNIGEIIVTIGMFAFVLFTTEGFDAFFNIGLKDMLVLVFYLI